jgi:glycosyltransferase involved in cell wall biosynthesis
MLIAFHAPMKPPTSPVPSGDRQMARQLIAALKAANHTVELAAIFATRDGAGDPVRQLRLSALGRRLADRLIARLRARPAASRPAAWLTYHLYYKAPDWIGPAVAAALGIPYLVAEASHAPKRAGGPWALGHRAAEAAIRAADAVIGFNSHDAACVLPLLARPERYHRLRPFTDTTAFARAAVASDAHRAALVSRFGLDSQAALLLTVAMMRDGDKLVPSRVLGRPSARLGDEKWQLLVVGDGPARAAVETALADLGPARVRYAGEQPPDALPAFHGASDIMVWPAIREAYGVALLEAQAAGLPVVAGDSGGVGDIVRHGKTGLLTRAGDAEAFAEAIRSLLRAPRDLARFAAAARRVTASEHSIAAAATALDTVLTGVVAEAAP